MKKFSILKNNQVVQTVNFDNDQAIEDFKAVLAKGEAWGLPERWVQDTPMSPLSEEDKAKAVESRIVELSPAIPESTDEEGNVIPEVPARMVTEYKFEAEYQIEVEDITAQVQAEKAAEEAKKLAKEKRKADRKAIDWSKTMTVKQLQEIVKGLVEEFED